MLMMDLHFYYNLRHERPYDVVNIRTGTHYFVDVTDAQLITDGNDNGLFSLPLHDQSGRKYLLRWRIAGEFDKYLGSTPPLR